VPSLQRRVKECRDVETDEKLKKNSVRDGVSAEGVQRRGCSDEGT